MLRIQTGELFACHQLIDKNRYSQNAKDRFGKWGRAALRFVAVGPAVTAEAMLESVAEARRIAR